MESKVIVFGGAGFIGSHLLRRLATGPEVREGVRTLYSVDIASPRFRVDGVTYLHGDVRDPLPPDLCGGGPALIFNLAAVHTTPGHEDWEYYWTNVNGAVNVNRFASNTGSGRIVFTSSIAVYGPSEAPKDEDAALEPESPYGRSKLLAERAHLSWRSERPEERRLTIVRPAVIFGLSERGNFTRLARLLHRGRFVYPGRTDTIKSCGYVEDLVSSMLFMTEDNRGASIYNFCYPERYTSEHICHAFCETAGYRAPRFVAPLPAMMAAGLGFEMLAQVGVKTSINRARITKLYRSTNIMPKRLGEAGFTFAYGLREALSDWRQASRVNDFD